MPAPPVLHIANKNYSSWSLRAWILMKALGIPFEERLHPFGGETRFTSFSPTGQVPCLHDGHVIVWDSLAIAEYLAESHPEVWPRDRTARAWARSAAAEMHCGFGALREQCTMSCGIRVRLAQVTQALRKDLDRIDALWRDGLSRFGGPFLAGDAWSAVDASFAPVAYRIQTYDLALSPPSLAYAAHLRAQPAMRAWFEAGIAERWRDAPHDEELTTWGVVIEDHRAT